jgi:hypothetical protein
MSAGGFHDAFFTASWPSGEFGGMGLEGAVRHAFKKELAAIKDEMERDKAFRDLQIIKIPFMMSSNFKTGGIEDEDIGTGSEWRILTDGGLGYSFG